MRHRTERFAALSPEGEGWRILKPGRNCWQAPLARRAALLVDGENYYRELEAGLRAARRSILILGWDFDGRIALRPDLGPEHAPPLGDFLRSLVEANADLEIRVLVWSVAVLHAPGAPAPLLFGAEWDNHPRIHVRLDTKHPIYAAHHQKVVVIDDALAFAGGIDLTVRRWDTRGHGADDPHRCEPDGNRCNPVHDMQMAVEGDAARALGDLARGRWRTATGEDIAPVVSGGDLWPADLAADFTDTPVAIARTRPGWGDEPAAREAAALTADALKAAQRAIYIEAQYLTAPYVGAVLSRSLAQASGPEIVIVLTRQSRGLAERFVMGENRDRLIRRLKKADRSGRLRVFYPVVPADDGERQVLVHSKLIIVDDIFLRVGSSNLNNRSVGLDTECDLAIEATDEATRATIVRLRNGLLGEHLDAAPDEVTTMIAAQGSLVRAVDALNTKLRGLRPFEAMTQKGPTRPVFGTALLDPRRPFEPLWFLGRKKQNASALRGA